MILIEDDRPAEALLGLSQEDREIFMMHWFLRDINDGIDTIGKKMTVCQLYARQKSHRKNVKRSTEKGREYLMSVLKEDPLGSRSIDSVKLSDAKEWAIRMSEEGYANFLFLNQSGLPKTASCYESMFQGLVRKYNKHHKLHKESGLTSWTKTLALVILRMAVVFWSDKEPRPPVLWQPNSTHSHFYYKVRNRK